MTNDIYPDAKVSETSKRDMETGGSVPNPDDITESNVLDVDKTENIGETEMDDDDTGDELTTETISDDDKSYVNGTQNSMWSTSTFSRNKYEPAKVDNSDEARPGECVMRTLFYDFTVHASRKMQEVMAEPLAKPLSKTLQRGEDSQFDQIIVAMGAVAEHCLPSLLKTLVSWYEKQLETSNGEVSTVETKKIEPKGKSCESMESKDIEALQEKRDLAIEFMFCLVLIEILQQLPLHPGHEELIGSIENVSFKHFKYREGAQTSPNATNIHMLADLYAEVVSIVAQSRFQSIRKRFTTELKELRAKEPSPQTTQSIISLLMGMKFFRVKMVPIDEFEASFLLMQDCAQYFLEAKDKDIKHALAGLFVEILVPVAASVKNEVNVPCLKNFVETLYSPTLEMCTKSKHRLAIFPLVTCLLCVSQKTFFLQNWYYFLAMCLSHLKNRDPKMSRVALESLYRLLWVYMIRIKCESNSATLSRLQSIVNSLFPKGSKGVIPRDTPLNIFVKIIQFIAQERMDFAMREIVFDLLSVGRPIKMILTPERMNVGLRAFLVVADSLQQKEGEPPMPRTSGALPSGNTLRIKKTFLNKLLTDDTARSIGMSTYFPHVRRVFVDILRALDNHYGRPLMMTSTQNVNKEPDEMLTGERKPRIDLFRTCVAAVPRLIPETMTASELVDLLARLTVHMDEDLKALAYQSLQTLVMDFSDWRQDVVFGFTQFLAKDIPDTFPQLLDNGLKMLLQLITSWKNAINSNLKNLKDEHNKSISRKTSRMQPPITQQSQINAEFDTNVFHQVEGFALVMLCNNRPCPRRVAVHILREVKVLIKLLDKNEETKMVIDVMDRYCNHVLEKSLLVVPSTEKSAFVVTSNVDLQWLADRSSSIWCSGNQDEGNSKISSSSLNIFPLDPWTICMFNFLHRNILISQCPIAVSQAWPVVYIRLNALYSVIDPTPVSDNRASLLRSSAPPRKPVSERDQYMLLWRSYVIFAARVVPPVPSPVDRCASPDLSLSIQGTLNIHNFLKHAWEEFENDSHSLNCMAVSEPKSWRFRSSSSPDNVVTPERNDNKLASASPTGFYKLIVPLLRCEVVDVRDAVVYALASTNPDALKDLMEELAPYIRDAIDKKQENMRRRRRRDALRLQLVKVFDLIAEHGTFGVSSCVLDRDTHSLHPTIVEYIDGARVCLETEADKESLRDIKVHFCNFTRKMIKSFPLESYPTLLKRDLRCNLFNLFRNWSGPYGASLTWNLPTATVTPAVNITELSAIAEDELQFAALKAMLTVLCCGPCFDAPGLLSEDVLYSWLTTLLASKDPKVYEVAFETVILLLECNSDVDALLDWVVDRCYTAEPQVADGCFLALAVIFSAREYPCDHYTAIINVTLMYTGCPRPSVHETALQLLQVLEKRFFDSVGLLPPEGEMVSSTDKEKEKADTLDILLSSTYCCTQHHLSQQLAQLHPELTMPMFSEITSRFQTARPEVRQLLLQYILPWLNNMELVDPNIPPVNANSTYYQYYSNEVRKAGPLREGWGSVEATEMVLNNLFYITAKFLNEHSKEIEEVWATLSSCWPNNLRVIMRYLFIVCGMASNELLSYAKKVTVFLARASPDRLLDEMLTELQTVETLNCMIERTETPPYFRLTNVRKISGCADPDPQLFEQNGSSNELSVEKGVIHTKRHSGEDGIAKKSSPSKSDPSLLMADSNYCTPRTNRPRFQNMPPQKFDENIPSIENDVGGGSASGDDDYTICREDVNHDDIPLPHPLPMPEYGGYFAPLKEYIPENTQPSTGFHRCNLAVILLTDVIVDSVDLDWSVHLPLMLHILFLGMDQSRNLIHQHCKQLLLNLLIVVTNHSDHLSVGQILLNRKVTHLNLGLPTPPVNIAFHNFTEPDPVFDTYLQSPIGFSQSTSLAVLPSPTSTCETVTSQAVTPTNEEVGSPISTCKPIQEIVKSLIDFIASKKDQVLWNYEDITAKVWSIKSGEQLDTFLQHVLRIFQESLPHALINDRWAQIALQLGLSCSSRHYAGRSLQVFRFLRVPITSRMLSDILSRLVETIAEQGEDMQGYVTELLLTLESAVDSLDSDFRPLDFMKELFKSTPNLNKDIGSSVISKRSAYGNCVLGQSHHPNINAHTRSTSYSVSQHFSRKIAGYPSNAEFKDIRRDAEAKHSVNKYGGNIAKSKSAHSLKLLDSASQDDKMLILAQLFWLAVSVLESDYEYEYLLALRLLNRVLHRLPLDRPDTVDKVDKLCTQLRWSSFQGVQKLLLKGCTNPAIYEAVVPLLSQFTLLLDLHVVDPTQNYGFPLNVIALLPYLLLHYEDANELCISAAENIAHISTEKGKKLENLGTVMTLYSRRTFSKESFQWTKCVVKYLHDTYAHISTTMLTFLIDLLEKGPAVLQSSVLNIIHCMFHYVDLSSSTLFPFNTDVLSTVAKFVEGPHHKEATKILKLVVTRSSTLVAAPLSQQDYMDTQYTSTMSPTFADVDVFIKKELPGRTMDFTFDITQIPVIGRPSSKNEGDTKSEENVDKQSSVISINNQAVNSPRRSSSLSPADNAAVGWKRPWMGQSRVRECLVNLLTTCGQRVGLPKSPSEDLLYSLNKVIFSQSSDLLERQSSMASSTEEVSVPDLSIESRRNENDHFGVFKDFDFLEYESESVEGESTDNFNWGVRRRPLSSGDFDTEMGLTNQAVDSLSEKTPLLTLRNSGLGGIDDSSDDEMGSESPLDEIHPLTSHLHDPHSSSSSVRLHERERRDSATRSDISDSSVGDLTPCNTSPNLPAVMSFRSIHRDDTEEMWRFQLCLLFEQQPTSSLYVFHLMYKLIKEMVSKSISVTQAACGILSEFEGSGDIQTHLTTVTCILAARANPPFVWFHPDAIPLAETLRFGLLQVREHLDTFLDRKDQTSECMETLKAILKLQQLRDESVGTDLINEESVVDIGKAFYKFHLQLLLFLETAVKMYASLINDANQANLENISDDVIQLKKSLTKAQEEFSDLSEDDTPSPQLLFPDKNNSAILKFLEEDKWSAALKFIKQNRLSWMNDIPSGPEDDDVTNVLTVYCNHLTETRPDVYVIIGQENISDIHSSLMDELMQLLTSLNETESKIKEQKEKNYASH